MQRLDELKHSFRLQRPKSRFLQFAQTTTAELARWIIDSRVRQEVLGCLTQLLPPAPIPASEPLTQQQLLETMLQAFQQTQQASSQIPPPAPQSPNLLDLEADELFSELDDLSPEEIDARIENDKLRNPIKHPQTPNPFRWLNQQPRSITWVVGILIVLISSFLLLQDASVQRSLHRILDGEDASRPEKSTAKSSKTSSERKNKPNQKGTAPNVVPMPSGTPPEL